MKRTEHEHNNIRSKRIKTEQDEKEKDEKEIKPKSNEEPKNSDCDDYDDTSDDSSGISCFSHLIATLFLFLNKNIFSNTESDDSDDSDDIETSHTTIEIKSQRNPSGNESL